MKITKSFFKKLLISQIILSGIYAYKMISYPYSLAPDELAKAMQMFDGLQPLPGNMAIVFWFVISIVLILSIIKLFYFRKIGRTLYIISIVGYFILAFTSNYYVYDVLEMLMEYALALLTGFTVAVIYFSQLNKSFK